MNARTPKRMKKNLASANTRTPLMNMTDGSFTFILAFFHAQQLSKYCLDAELPAMRNQ